MSALTAQSTTFSFLNVAQEILANLFHRPTQDADPLEALRSLPDHVLLDIGVDPRAIETGPALMIGNFDTVTGRHLSASVRTLAKS